MHSNNYFIEDIRGDVRWGSHHVNIEYGEGNGNFLQPVLTNIKINNLNDFHFQL